jgi:autoinducer 2-degrading protein
MVIFQINHIVKPEFIEAYKAAVREDARNSTLEEGVLRFEVFQDQVNSAQFTLLEVYRDIQARELHLKKPYLLKFREILNGQGMLTLSESNEVNLLFPDEIRN